MGALRCCGVRSEEPVMGVLSCVALPVGEGF